jgi:UDP-GlcNAc:undecaprenyl-phosphate GlcNAc-1-phosphate transferase
MIFLIGLLDDIKPLHCITKLLGQISAASITSLLGLKIKFLANPLYYFDHTLSPHIKLDAISSFLITVAFLVLISNAINLIDGIDGLAAGVSVISAVAIWAISLSPLLYRPDAAILAATLAGASLGFLRYNFNPARMFLGDNGSYLLGFVLASLSCLGLAKKITVAIITPLLILIFALPLLDCFYTIIRRSLNKKDILKPDSEHLHHQLERPANRQPDNRNRQNERRVWPGDHADQIRRPAKITAEADHGRPFDRQFPLDAGAG